MKTFQRRFQAVAKKLQHATLESAQQIISYLILSIETYKI